MEGLGTASSKETGDSPVVLVVEDERDLADVFSSWLADAYDVRTAYTGEGALDAVDDTVDVVLLDRRLPDISGDDVLGRIRERGHSCRVALVTAVDPDFDILKLDIDEYLTKPITADDLLSTVDHLATRNRSESDLQRFFALASKRDTLEANKTPSELRQSSAYQVLTAELADLRDQVNTQLTEQAEPGNDTYLRYPRRRVVFDSMLLAVVPAVLIGIHLGFPDGLERILAYGTPSQNILVSLLTTVVHVDLGHLAGNIIGYVLIASLTYVVCLRISAANWFYLTAAPLVFVLPLLTRGVGYGLSATVYPGYATQFLGFSDVVAGFVGFLLVAFLVLLRTVYDHRDVFLVGSFMVLVALDVLLGIFGSPLVTITAGLTAVCGLWIIRNRVKATRRTETGVPILLKQFSVILLVTIVFVGFGVGLVPAQTPGTQAVWILGHLLGFGVGFAIAIVTALLVNLFPIRDRIRERGHRLPRRLL